MKATIYPRKVKSDVFPPASKSMAHRLLICAALAEGTSIISDVTLCEDVLATIDCLRALGVTINIDDKNTCTVTGCNMLSTAPTDVLKCRESGSTLRFIIPIAALSGAKVILCGSERLMERPLSVYEQLFEEHELFLQKHDNFIYLDGPMKSGQYSIKANVSSQFISGLLFALPLIEGTSTINILPPFESKSYIDLTLSALKKFGINAYFKENNTIEIPGNQKYKATDVTVEKDYSNAAFLDALNLMGSEINVLALDENSLQGDKVYKEFYPLLKDGTPTIDISNSPDLGPILFALAAELNGAVFTGTARLRIKESDRVAAMAEELSKFGADIEIAENSVVVKKTKLHAPSEPIYAHNDHRIVMAISVIATKYGATIYDAQAVSKSYPNFFEDLKNIGFEVNLYD